MKQGDNPYTWAGCGLFVSGALVATSSLFILGVAWFTALGLAMIIIAIILLALARSVPKLSPEFSRVLFETGTENLAVLLEELAVSTRAIYLPPRLSNGKSRALIPLAGTLKAEMLKEALPNRLIVRYGAGAQDIGLLITTPGSAAAQLVSDKTETDTELLSATLTAFFSGTLGLADAVNVTNENGSIRVAFSQLRHERVNDRTDRVLGSAPASVATAVAAKMWDYPMIISSEGGNSRKYIVVIERLK
ncbi:hypothetical protein Dform_01808 [Dehalogenimonas formicexedens]|uniref:Uncharacterized protein n=1 Tax=Dehalogenimonas formicexedens TaxID=1839801 RepID=A0A1P8F9I6_9CHLR|nr:hypothetical protein Dform_01808 [Dehalogenimonas formicexedens]